MQVRTDRTIPFYEGDDNLNVNVLRDILVTYSFYNFDLGYCQVCTMTQVSLLQHILEFNCGVLHTSTFFKSIVKTVRLVDYPLKQSFSVVL